MKLALEIPAVLGGEYEVVQLIITCDLVKIEKVEHRNQKIVKFFSQALPARAEFRFSIQPIEPSLQQPF